MTASPSVNDVVERRDDPGADLAPLHGEVTVDTLGIAYGSHRVLRDVTVRFEPRRVHALIGPSGCGKSSLLRVVNRMHELTPGARHTGVVRLDGRDIHGPDVHPVRVRRAIGMVFQRPNPFPSMSIFDNVAAGVRLGGGPKPARIDEVVERSLRRAALWDQVKDRLSARATSLSGGQQQRLCIARALAVEPEVLLMDEPCASLDQIATGKIEDLIRELRDEVTIVLVTHNMHQAHRVSDTTTLLVVDEDRIGYLVEHGPTDRIFTAPDRALTADYVAGRFG